MIINKYSASMKSLKQKFILPNISIITEGGNLIGNGHISRCSALQQAFCKQGIKANLYIDFDDEISINLKSTRSKKFVSWLKNRSILNQIIKTNDILIIDSYKANKSVYDLIAKNVFLPVYVDDYYRILYPRGVIINTSQNQNDVKKIQKLYTNNTCLVGLKYSSLRPAFWKNKLKKIKDKIKNILIIYNGDDIQFVLPSIISALQNIDSKLKIKVILSTKQKSDLKNLNNSIFNQVKILTDCSSTKMKHEMQNADLAISSGGQILLELCAVGVASIVIISAENQRKNCQFWHNKKIIEFINTKDKKQNLISNIEKKFKNLISKEIRIKKSLLAQKYINGKGAINTAEELLKIYENSDTI